MGLSAWLDDAERVDVALYAAVAKTPTPALDRVLGHLSRAADHSRLSLAIAGILAAVGGRAGRRAARDGLVATAVTSLTVNLVVKPVGGRRRPDRVAVDVPVARHVRMPTSGSLPSGHAASAFAFATGVGRTLPTAALPLHVLAGAVGYSRVHTGVHYPGDVVLGAVLGTAVGQLATHTLHRHRRCP